jgi:hypothetical protein
MFSGAIFVLEYPGKRNFTKSTFPEKVQSIAMGDVLSCAEHTDATATNNVRIFIYWFGHLPTVYIILIILSLPCAEQKRQNPLNGAVADVHVMSATSVILDGI